MLIITLSFILATLQHFAHARQAVQIEYDAAYMGSSEKVKVETNRMAYRFEDGFITRLPTKSGVPEQPLGEGEAELGAVNRLKSLLANEIVKATLEQLAEGSSVLCQTVESAIVLTEQWCKENQVHCAPEWLHTNHYKQAVQSLVSKPYDIARIHNVHIQRTNGLLVYRYHNSWSQKAFIEEYAAEEKTTEKIASGPYLKEAIEKRNDCTFGTLIEKNTDQNGSKWEAKSWFEYLTKGNLARITFMKSGAERIYLKHMKPHDEIVLASLDATKADAVFNTFGVDPTRIKMELHQKEQPFDLPMIVDYAKGRLNSACELLKNNVSLERLVVAFQGGIIQAYDNVMREYVLYDTSVVMLRHISAENPSNFKEVVVVGDLVRIDFEGTEDIIAALRKESGAKETFGTKFLAKEGVIAHGSTWQEYLTGIPQEDALAELLLFAHNELEKRTEHHASTDPIWSTPLQDSMRLCWFGVVPRMFDP